MSDANGEFRQGGGEPVFLLPASLSVMVAIPLLLVVVRGFLDPDLDEWLVYAFGFVPSRYAADGAGIAWPGGEGAVIWTFLTHALLHEGWAHVFVNMAMFAAIGRMVIERIGTARFLALAAASTVAGAIGHLVVEWGSQAPMIGASGAVSGLFGALLRFVFHPVWLPAPTIGESLADRRVRGAILALVLMNVALVLTGTGLVGGAGGSIAWGAHLGGFLVGFFGWVLFDRR